MSPSRSKLAVCCLYCIGAMFGRSPATSAAQSTDELEAARFRQVLEAVGDENHDGIIERVEFAKFLQRNTTNLVQQLQQSAPGLSVSIDPVAFQRTIDGIARQIFNKVNRDNDAGIDIKELNQFEEAELPWPFKGSVKDLLPPPPAGMAPQEQPKPVLDVISDWISVRKSFLDSKDIGNPATFALTGYGKDQDGLKTGQHRTSWQLQGAISLQPLGHVVTNFLGNMTATWNPLIVLEANVNSDITNNTDTIVHRVGVEGTLFDESTVNQGSWSHNYILTLDYTTDRQYAVDMLGGTVQYSPDKLSLGIGRYLPIIEPVMYYRWRPYVGFTYANVLDPAENPKLQAFSNYVNFFTRAGLELAIWSRLKITPEFALYQELVNQQDAHVLFDITGRLALDEKDRASVQISYERGQKAPSFQSQDVVSFGLGIKL